MLSCQRRPLSLSSSSGSRPLRADRITLVIVLRALAFVLGVVLVRGALLSGIRTFVLPRSDDDKLTKIVFLLVRRIFDVRLRWARSYQKQDSVLAIYAPIALLVLPGVWLILVLIGYTGVYWALGVGQWRAAFLVSGSSLLTLGFATVGGLFATVLTFSEATIGLGLVALLIAYLPTMYAAFQRREEAVTLLEVRAGSPPSAVTMITRYAALKRLDKLGDLWASWETWFASIGESHTTLPALVFFRSPDPDHSWVTAAGTVLDTAALVIAAVDIPRDPQADLCLRAGFLTLRRIANYFDITHNAAPAPGDPISISRDEFDAAYDALAAVDVPLKPDRDRAWRDFAGWRVNYDTTLLTLARLTVAPAAPWTSDRPPR